VTAAWSDCISVECPNCRAPVNAYCVLDVNGKRYHKHAPCISRLRAAERALEAS
jgi:hypothetical protein